MEERYVHGIKSEMMVPTASYQQQQSQNSEPLSYFGSFLVSSKVLNKIFCRLFLIQLFQIYSFDFVLR